MGIVVLITSFRYHRRTKSSILCTTMKNYYMILWCLMMEVLKISISGWRKQLAWVLLNLCWRIIAWLCTKDGLYINSQICIVTGPNQDIAIKLIKRLKGIFESKLGLYFQNNEIVLELNGCTIEAFPSNHLDSYRSLINPKFTFLDEADMFRKGEQEDVRHVSERYVGKSDP